MISLRILLPASFFSVSVVCEAVELSELVGEWSLAEINSPSRLIETYLDNETMEIRFSENSQEAAGEGELLTDINYPDPLVASTRAFSVAADGQLSGDEMGKIERIRGNRVVYVEDGEVANVYANATGDLLVTGEQGGDQMSLAVCLKKPETMTGADLAGNWRLLSMGNPHNVTKTFVSGKLADTFYEHDPFLVTGPLTLDAEGNISGFATGTYEITGPGTAVARLPGQVFEIKVNASASVFTSTLDGGGEGEQEILLFVKEPESLAVVDLAGGWSVSSFKLPTILMEVFFDTVTAGVREVESDEAAGPNEVLVDVFHPDAFVARHFELQADASGSITGLGAGASFSVTGPNSVELSINGDNPVLYPNADKTVMISGITDSDENEILVFVKKGGTVASSFDERAELEIAQGDGESLILNWNAAEGTCLEGSNDLTSADWTRVPMPSNLGSYLVTPEESSFRFYRVAEKVVD